VNQQLAIKVSNLSKKYVVGKLKDTSIRTSLSNIFSKSNSKSQTFWALTNISFEIEKGDVIGIIGKNGAGKSTLLKILSQITKPTEGKIEINGRIASLLEVGTGFHPELTGRENIFLNGTILGMTRKEVKEKFNEIVAFSGVEKFIDTPVKHYSSGMYVRLAFAVAAHLEPEILIIDEVLAVGDVEFQKKCLGKMKEVAGEGRTVIFVSHDINAITSLCKKTILLEHGKLLEYGDTADIVTVYLKKFNDVNSIWQSNKESNQAFISKANCNFTGEQPHMKLGINVTIAAKSETPNCFIAFDIVNGTGQIVGQSIPSLQPFIQLNNETKEFSFEINIDAFVPDDYYIAIWIGPHFSHTIDWVQDVLKFQVIESPQKGRAFPHSRDHGSITPLSRIVND
jgi:lipopolysaccharide transport system ATP-binding protein